MAAVIIVSPQFEQRSALEALFAQLPRFSTINSVDTIKSARMIFKPEKPADYILVSEHITSEIREEFVAWIRSLKLGRKTTFVSICSVATPSTTDLAEHLVAGSHGVLREPFSLPALEEVLKVSKGVKFKGTRLRLRTAAGLYLTNALDKLYTEQGLSHDNNDLPTKVKTACADFKKLTGVSVTLEAVQSTSIKSPEYAGVSRRVRDIYEERLKRLVGRIFDR